MGDQPTDETSARRAALDGFQRTFRIPTHVMTSFEPSARAQPLDRDRLQSLADRRNAPHIPAQAATVEHKGAEFAALPESRRLGVPPDLGNRTASLLLQLNQKRVFRPANLPDTASSLSTAESPPIRNRQPPPVPVPIRIPPGSTGSRPQSSAARSAVPTSVENLLYPRAPRTPPDPRLLPDGRHLALTGRATGPQQVTWDVFSIELLAALSGAGGVHFAGTPATGITLKASCAVDGVTRQRTNRLLATANRALSVAQSARDKIRGQADLFEMAYARAVLDVSDRFLAHLVRLKEKRVTSLWTLESCVRRWRPTLVWLHDQWTRKPHGSAVALMDHVYKTYSFERLLRANKVENEVGNDGGKVPTILDVARSLLDAVMSAHAKCAAAWLLDGELNRYASGWVITGKEANSNENTRKDEAWHATHVISPALPDFMRASWLYEAALQKMLTVGRSQRALRQRLDNVGGGKAGGKDDGVEKTEAAYRRAVHCSRLVQIISDPPVHYEPERVHVLHDALQAMGRVVCGALVRELLDGARVAEHVRVVHAHFLLGDHAFTAALVNQLIEYGDMAALAALEDGAPVTEAARPTFNTAIASDLLTAALKEAAGTRKSVQTKRKLPPLSVRVDMCDKDDEPCSSRARAHALRLAYVAPSLAGFLLDATTLARYQRAFTRLFGLRELAVTAHELATRVSLAEPTIRKHWMAAGSLCRRFVRALMLVHRELDLLATFLQTEAWRQASRLRAYLDAVQLDVAKSAAAWERQGDGVGDDAVGTSLMLSVPGESTEEIDVDRLIERHAAHLDELHGALLLDDRSKGVSHELDALQTAAWTVAQLGTELLLQAEHECRMDDEQRTRQLENSIASEKADYNQTLALFPRSVVGDESFELDEHRVQVAGKLVEQFGAKLITTTKEFQAHVTQLARKADAAPDTPRQFAQLAQLLDALQRA